MADTEKVTIVVEAEDNASRVLGNIGSAIGGLNSSLRHYNSMMSTFNRTMINAVEDVGSAIYDFTSDSINSFSELSDQHARTLGAMANDYDKTIESQQKFMENSEKLKQQAIDLAKYGIGGIGSLATPTDVSLLQTELVKAGVSADAMLTTDIVSKVLQFSQANDLETAQAVEFAVSLGNQFGIGYEGWGEMLDKVSHTADLSIIEVSDIVASMKYAGGISSGVDVPMEETLAMISILGNYGLSGSQAGSGIQALLTRLLTGDTTVITDAMKEVAPPKALEAFYDFSNYAKSSGSDITYDDILNETFTEKDITGELRPMDEVVDALETTMDDLNDEEQAWFAKKLFGLYQMKSAYALINGDDSGEMALSDVIKEIEDNSTGTNANKLAELVNSQSGQVESTKNLITGIQTELGQMLEPTTLAILDEVQAFLKDPSHYEINWESIQSALDESCDAIEETYGTAIADAVRNLGGFTIDLGQVMEELAPEFMSGMLDVFNSAISGNILGEDGVADNWEEMISNMKISVEDLPDDLQKLGEAVVNVVDMLGKLATFNIVTTIAQLVTSVLQLALMTVNTASVIVNSGGVGGTGAGGTGAGGTGAGTGAGVVAGTAGAIAGGIAGGMAGDKIGDEVGETAKDIAESLGAEEETADVVGGVADTATTVGGAVGGAKLGKWLFGGGLAGLVGKAGAKLSWARLMAAESGTSVATALGIGDVLGGALAGGIPAVLATAGILIKNKKDTDEKMSNASQTSDIVESGGSVGFDKYGNIIKYDGGDIVDFKKGLQVFRDEYDEYKYNNGRGNTYYSDAMPEKGIDNMFGLSSSYKKELAEWQARQEQHKQKMAEEESNFYKVQDNYYLATGNKLKWDDYYKNKNDYSDYLAMTSEHAQSLAELREFLNSAGKLTSDWSSIIPGFNMLSQKGQESAIENYLENQINLSPVFSMDAPQVQVDITVDSKGNILNQKTSILNPEFSKSISSWYHKTMSQIGSTTK